MKRIATALVGIPVALLITIYTPLWLFAVAVAVLAGFCFDELRTLGDSRGFARPGRWLVIPGSIVTASFMGGPDRPDWVMMTLVLALMTAAVAMTFDAPLDSMFPKMGVAALGIVYCCVLLGFVVWIDRDLLIVLFAIIWTGDSAAYYGGRAFGRHLLAPRVSPKKTVEGAFAGLMASMIAGVLVGVWLVGGPPSTFLVAAVLAGGMSQIGDLAESALKRSAGVKDSSSILPGHGGMLDRLDGLLFAAPVFYWFFRT